MKALILSMTIAMAGFQAHAALGDANCNAKSAENMMKVDYDRMLPDEGRQARSLVPARTANAADGVGNQHQKQNSNSNKY